MEHGNGDQTSTGTHTATFVRAMPDRRNLWKLEPPYDFRGWYSSGDALNGSYGHAITYRGQFGAWAVHGSDEWGNDRSQSSINSAYGMGGRTEFGALEEMGYEVITAQTGDLARASEQRRMNPMAVDADFLDRVAGALLGMAAGDALGAPYEFGPPLADGVPLGMTGGGSLSWAPGEWTDDTSMAVPIARAFAEGHSLDDDATLDEIVGAWQVWAQTAPDVGIQTRVVLGSVAASTAAAAWEASRRHHERRARSGGNGSLMRTAPVALFYLGEGLEERLVAAARRVSQLTHWEEDAGDACVIWCLGIRHAVRTGVLDLRSQVAWLPIARRDRWARLIDEAEVKRPRDFANNSWVIEALQGAWSAIHHSSGLVDAIERAVRGGRDADTVAAIAGGLAGSAHGSMALPGEWLRVLHGWPGVDAVGLAELATRGARAATT